MSETLPTREQIESGVAMSELADTLRQIRNNDESYEIRNPLVLQALGQAATLGLNAGIRIDPAEPGWPVVFIELPEIGQVSWHVPEHFRPWDGHTTEQKYAHIAQFVEQWIPFVVAGDIREDGLTYAEGVVIDHLTAAHIGIGDIDPPLSTEDICDFNQAINTCQRILISRIAVRSYPEHWIY